MSIYKYFILFACAVLLSAIEVKAQDRYVLKYKVAVYQLDSLQKKQLNKFYSSFPKGTIDSVFVVGFADSLGSYEANLKLSRNRAKGVISYLKKVIPYEVKYRYVAGGEKDKKIEQVDRRVEVIFYTRELYFEDTIKALPSPKNEMKCLRLADEILAISNQKHVHTKKQDFVLLELEINEVSKGLVKYLNCHYAVESYDSSLKYVKVKWIKRRSGSSWWLKDRFQTMIPKGSFDKYQIFVLKDTPCIDCDIRINDTISSNKVLKDTIIANVRYDSCWIVDEFIMNNIRYKIPFFSRKKFVVKVPKEYVDNSVTYYQDFETSDIITWYEKKGKRNDSYLFYELPMTKINGGSGRVYSRFKYSSPKISKRVPCCMPVKSGIIPCDAMSCSPSPREYFDLGLELGNIKLINTNVTYVGIGLYQVRAFDQFNITIGVDNNFRLFANSRYQYNYLTVPFGFINPFNGWYQNGRWVGLNNDLFLRLYAGTSLITARPKTHERFFFHDVHLGLSLALNYSFIDRIFIQYGYGYDYSNRFSKEVVPTLNYGVIFKL